MPSAAASRFNDPALQSALSISKLAALFFFKDPAYIQKEKQLINERAKKTRMITSKGTKLKKSSIDAYN